MPREAALYWGQPDITKETTFDKLAIVEWEIEARKSEVLPRSSEFGTAHLSA